MNNEEYKFTDELRCMHLTDTDIYHLYFWSNNDNDDDHPIRRYDIYMQSFRLFITYYVCVWYSVGYKFVLYYKMIEMVQTMMERDKNPVPKFGNKMGFGYIHGINSFFLTQISVTYCVTVIFPLGTVSALCPSISNLWIYDVSVIPHFVFIFFLAECYWMMNSVFIQERTSFKNWVDEPYLVWRSESTNYKVK